MTDVPEVITRYLAASDRKDNEALVACFTDDAIVLDEGQTFRGRDEIRGWREELASKYTYTAEMTGSTVSGPDEYQAHMHLVGDFPGGVVDLTYAFTLRGDRIASLAI